MRHCKRAFSLLLAMVLLACLVYTAPSASAAGLTTMEKADALYELGLFRGKYINADGSVDYALDESANRNEGAIMLIRLMGKESLAEEQYASGAIVCPFTDMENATWAKPGVTWLYQGNYILGTSAATYNGSGTLTAQHYVVLLLRALGYFESAGDFTYSGALDFAVEKGLLTSAQRSAWQTDFRREGIVELSYNALYLTLNGSEQTLVEKLAEEGVFDRKDTGEANVSAKVAPVSLSVKYTAAGNTGSGYFEEKSYGNAVCGDVDGDGKLEIVYGIRSIFCVDAATGRLKWRVASGHDATQSVDFGTDYTGETFTYIPTQLIDYDGDGRLDIFTVTNIYGTTKCNIAVYDGQGRFKVRWTTDLRVWGIKVDDIDGDGKCEVIAGYGVGGSGQPAVYVYNNDGSVRWSKHCGYGLYSNSIETVDLDGDGQKEIVLLYDEDRIVAFHNNGTEVTSSAFGGSCWSEIRFFEGGDVKSGSSGSQSVRNGLMGTHSGIVAEDMDGNGTLELVGVSMFVDIGLVEKNMSSGSTAINSFDESFRYFAPFILNRDRTRYVNKAKGFDWSAVPTSADQLLSMDNSRAKIENPDVQPVTADLDGDGYKEILFSSYDGKVHCFSLDGTEHGAWPFTIKSSVVSFATEPVVADINGDGWKEVIFATYTESGQVAERGKLYVLDFTGKELASVTLPAQYGRTADSVYPNGSQTKPCVADVDRDGKMEIIVSTYSCGVCVYDVA